MGRGVCSWAREELTAACISGWRPKNTLPEDRRTGLAGAAFLVTFCVGERRAERLAGLLSPFLVPCRPLPCVCVCPCHPPPPPVLLHFPSGASLGLVLAAEEEAPCGTHPHLWSLKLQHYA